MKSANTLPTQVAQASQPAVYRFPNLRAVAFQKRIRTCTGSASHWLPPIRRQYSTENSEEPKNADKRRRKERSGNTKSGTTMNTFGRRFTAAPLLLFAASFIHCPQPAPRGTCRRLPVRYKFQCK